METEGVIRRSVWSEVGGDWLRSETGCGEMCASAGFRSTRLIKFAAEKSKIFDAGRIFNALDASLISPLMATLIIISLFKVLDFV